MPKWFSRSLLGPASRPAEDHSGSTPARSIVAVPVAFP